LKDAYDLYGKLRPAVSDLALVDQILEEYQTREAGRRILHLSDLHFGTEQALEHEAYLSAHLESIADSVDRVVITGDLFNQPRREEALAFRNFRAMLTRNRKEDIIVIPGNHDQKWLGNFGAPLREAAKLEWSSLVVDDELQCVFLCFNSSLDADFARGKVTVHQLREMGTAFETQCICRPAVRNYLRIALVHHHPFSFETAQETWIARALSRANLSDEYFLRMDDAESFLKWCARRGVPLLLHGHKHVPRYVTAYISPPDGENWPGRRLTAVGCGTSLGAEGKPLSYNLVRWDSHVQSWTVSFFADPGDGSGFTRQYVAVHAVSAATSE